MKTENQLFQRDLPLTALYHTKLAYTFVQIHLKIFLTVFNPDTSVQEAYS